MSARTVLLVMLALSGLVVAPVFAPVASARHYCGENLCVDYHQFEPLLRCWYQWYVKHQPCS